MVARLEVVRAAPQSKRVPRSPRHSFAVAARPYQIQPCAIAPVWPGETMKMAMLAARVVSDPIKHPLLGWWHEYYFFYVKLNDLAQRDAVVNMLMTPGADISTLKSAADLKTYHNGRGINWTRKCLEVVVNEYFRDEGEFAFDGDKVLDGLPLAVLQGDTWLDSAKRASAVPQGGNDHELPGENPVIPDNVPAGFETHFAQWEQMRAMQMTTATFEDWLKAFGVKAPAKYDTEELYRPELIRYVRDWQYPSNTIDPANGKPSSAVSWGIAERMDKDRYFKEPGFIFGVTVTRPKVYMGRQFSAAAHMMQDAFSWLPATLHDQPYTSLKALNDQNGPLQHPTASAASISEEYWVDIRDLAVHGDQFLSVGAIGANDYTSLIDVSGAIAMPRNDLSKRFATSADIDSLFVDATKNRIRQDGVFQPTIQSRITDTSL